MSRIYFNEGIEMFKDRLPRPSYDGTAPSSLRAEGWDYAASNALSDDFRCGCLEPGCPLHDRLA